MAINDSIQNFSRWNNSSYVADSKLIDTLNELRKKNELDFDKFAADLEKKRIRKEIDDQKKLLERRLKLADDYEKAAEKQRKKLNDLQYNEWVKREKKKLSKQMDFYKKYLEDREKEDQRRARLEERNYYRSQVFGKTGLITKGRALSQIYRSEGGGLAGFTAVADTLINGLSTLSKNLDNTIEDIAKYQGRINTRLAGYSRDWSSISTSLSGAVGISPYLQTKKLYENVDKLVNKGVAFNVEQRAFLETIADKIATTFHADSQTLLQTIRIQQADTTAARLGLEANLNTYFNNMYQTTEYLSDAFDTVSSSIYEATAQLSATAGVGFEYQVQKWLGSLYSVGMSSGSVSGIASVLGMLGSGNISGLSNSALNRLLVMASSRTGTSYADLLKGGLTAERTNELLNSMVEYLADIAKATESNLVLRSSYANIFGLTASDLVAISNLAPSLSNISSRNLDYSGAMSELYWQAGMMGERTSLSEMLSNAWSNFQYGLASNIASNPALFGLWKAAGLLEEVTGGISIPDISVFGTGVALNTTVADLLRVGALGGSILSGIGGMISSLSTGGSGSSMLNALGILGNRVSMVSRGSGLGITQSGVSTSQSMYVGNAAAGDIKESALAMAEEQKEAETAKVKDPDAIELKDVNDSILLIYDLISSVVTGSASFTVKQDSFPGLGS